MVKCNMACVQNKNKTKKKEQKLKKTIMLEQQEYSNCHEPLSQKWINGRYQTFKQYIFSNQTY